MLQTGEKILLSYRNCVFYLTKSSQVGIWTGTVKSLGRTLLDYQYVIHKRYIATWHAFLETGVMYNYYYWCTTATASAAAAASATATATTTTTTTTTVVIIPILCVWLCYLNLRFYYIDGLERCVSNGVMSFLHLPIVTMNQINVVLLVLIMPYTSMIW